jgi:hypothetical protein
LVGALGRLELPLLKQTRRAVRRDRPCKRASTIGSSRGFRRLSLHEASPTAINCHVQGHFTEERGDWTRITGVPKHSTSRRPPRCARVQLRALITSAACFSVASLTRGYLPSNAAMFSHLERPTYGNSAFTVPGNERPRANRAFNQHGCMRVMHTHCMRRVGSATGVSCSIPPPHAALISVLLICFTYEHAAPHGRRLNGPGPAPRVVCRSHGPH